MSELAEQLGLLVFAIVDVIDRLMMRCSEKYKDKRFWQDAMRLRIEGDPVWNALLLQHLRIIYGYDQGG